MTSVTIQHFHQDIEAAEQASATGPVFITTEDGDPKRVLIDIEEYRRLNPSAEARALNSDISTLAERLAVPDDEYFDWEPERLYVTFRPMDLD